MDKLTQIFNWERIQYVLANPRENPQETVLLLGILILIPLISLVLILFLASLRGVVSETKQKLTRKKIAITGLALLFFLLIIAGGLSFYSSQPNYCHSCHLMKKEYISWKRSSHSKVTCFACHQKPGVLGWIEAKIRINKMILRFAAKSYTKPIMADIDDQSCLQCHNNLTRTITSRYGIKMSHQETSAAGFKCNDCHNTIAHGKVTTNPHYPSMNDCITCHNDEKASTDCNYCHTRDVGEKPNLRITDYPKTHLPPLTTCRGCHNLEKEGCTACHGVEMPHPLDWMQPGKITHARVAAFEKKQICFKCHQDIDYCNNCHRFPGHAENWKQIHSKGGLAVEKSCMSCHAKEMSPVFCGLCH